MKKYDNKKIIIITMFTALFIVLSIFGTIDLYGVKLTLQNLPLFIVAILYGPYAGAFCGFMGMFINQLITYGISITTIFWVIPHTLAGLITGFIFENKIVKMDRNFKFAVTIILMQFLITILNTVALFIDSKLFGYYSAVTVFGTFMIRIMTSFIISVIYSLIIPNIVFAIKKSG